MVFPTIVSSPELGGVGQLVGSNHAPRYLCLAESVREGKKARQRTIRTLGRQDVLKASGEIDRLIASLARHSERAIVLNDMEAGDFATALARAMLVCVLHRLFVSGSERSCEKWMRDYAIPGTDSLGLHHLYRAMAWLGE